MKSSAEWPTNNPRYPAVPLVVHDPYFSIWSFADRLWDEDCRHWTGAGNPMFGAIRIDEKYYRYMGHSHEPTVRQVGLRVTPTRTIYAFEADGIRFCLTFMTPAIPEDLDLLSRPVTYISWDVESNDGKEHDVQIYFDIEAQCTVDSVGQSVEWGRHHRSGLDVLRIGTVSQQVLARAGDNLRIDWGYLYLGLPHQDGASSHIGPRATRALFAKDGSLPVEDDLRLPRAVNHRFPALAVRFDLAKVIAGERQHRRLMVAYDDLYSAEFLFDRLRPWWRRNGNDVGDLLRAANQEYPALVSRCTEYDRTLMDRFTAAGGEQYAELCAVAHRHCLAAHKLVAATDGSPLYFSKENFSNGCMGTVDVTYPSSPFFLMLQPTLLEAQVVPILQYAHSGRWKFEFAPHDLGTYPLANGQVYGGAETSEVDQMPVEECGNMLILVAALAHVKGDATFAKPYEKMLRQWAVYLEQHGYDPSNQLCTDDFAGHLARNVNLSLKAIVGLAGFARLCEQWNQAADATHFREVAEDFAGRWVKDADAGDHTLLVFDRPETWSLKYNLVWDRLLKLGLFPDSVAQREVKFYAEKQGKFGVALDNRKAYTKLDWVVWAACLSGERDDFDRIMQPLYSWLHESPTRVPLTDWYWTEDGKQAGFQARSVVGGIYIRALMVEMDRATTGR